MDDRCVACGAPLLDGGEYCPPAYAWRGYRQGKDPRFEGCEATALATVYRARPHAFKTVTNLHYGRVDPKEKSDLERFYAAYGDDCNYSIHGPLPLTDEARPYLRKNRVMQDTKGHEAILSTDVRR